MPKGKKGKSSSKKKASSKYPPPVILKDWPGKLTEEEIKERHRELLDESKLDYSLVRITQVDWEFHDFYLMIDRKAPILVLQQIISQVQHQGAVLPRDVLIYKSLNDKSTTNSYQPYDLLQFTENISRFARDKSPWPISQPIYLNNQYSPNGVQYLHINYDIIPYMNFNVQKTLTDDIWDRGVFKNCLVMSFSDHTKKQPQSERKSQQSNNVFDLRRVSMIKVKK